MSESKQFPQERARKTYESLVAAAEAVFSEKGFDSTQTPDIAERAGVSVGTFYRYFGDKKAVLLEVLRRDSDRALERVMAELTPERFSLSARRATLHSAFSLISTLAGENLPLKRLFVQMSMRDADVAALRASIDREVVSRLAGLFAAICGPDDVSDPEATAYVLYNATLESMLAVSGGRGPSAVAADRAMSALVEVVYRALFPRPPDP